MSGTARLDSSWLDTRFHDANLVHHDGDNPTSHFTGDGRVTKNPKFTAFDVALQAQPLSFTTFALSYPRLPFRGNVSGPLRIRGTLDDLDITASLSGDAGSMAVRNLRSRLAERSRGPRHGERRGSRRAGAHGIEYPAVDESGRAGGVRHSRRLDRESGRLVHVELDQSRVEPVDVSAATASLSFGDGRMHVDTLGITSSAAHISANGTLGLAPNIVDSLSYSVIVDSPVARDRGFRRAPRPTVRVTRFESGASTFEQRQIRDSLFGTVHTEGKLVGSIDTLLARDSSRETRLFVAGNRVEHASGSYAVAGLPADSRGTIHARADSLLIATVGIDSMQGDLTLANRSRGDMSFAAASNRRAGSFVLGSHPRSSARRTRCSSRSTAWAGCSIRISGVSHRRRPSSSTAEEHGSTRSPHTAARAEWWYCTPTFRIPDP